MWGEEPLEVADIGFQCGRTRDLCAVAGAENSYWRRLGPRRSRTTNQDFAPNQTAGSFKLSQEVIELALNSDPLAPVVE